MRNVQRRSIAAPAERVGELIDGLGSPADVLWPARPWPALRLDRGLQPGSSGGHGPIRYTVAQYDPGRRLRLTFDPSFGDGFHELRVEPADTEGACHLVHELDATLHGRMRLLWPIAVRALHEALVADLFDNAERLAAAAPVASRRHPSLVRALLRLAAPRPRQASVADLVGGTPRARLLAAETTGRGPADLADAWRLGIGRDAPGDPTRWTTAIFGDPPPVVVGLFRLRNALVPLLGIERSRPDVFAPRAATDQECLVSADKKHLDFRASVLLESDDAGRRTVTLTTLAWVHNRAGRVYLLPVRVAHPIVVRAMLSRAARRLASAKGGRHGVPPVFDHDRAGAGTTGRRVPSEE